MTQQNALVAAAKVLMGERIDDPSRQKRGWQDEAWAFYDEAGPLRYGVTWLANLISKAHLQAARVLPSGDTEVVETGPAADAVEALAGGIGGQAGLLRSLAVQLTVPGIGYLVGTEAGETWRVYSSDTIRLAQPATPAQPAVYQVQEQEGKWVDLDPEHVVVKVWRPHERFFWEPDSPARAALPALRELRRVGQYIDATLVSRLAGAGIFIIPQEAEFPTAPSEGQTKHPFVTEVMEVMMTAVRQPGTAAQVVPIPITVPGEYADKFKQLNFATELNEKILDMRESALRQTSIALDIPAEILTGMSDVNHWTAWQVEESAVKIHAEPLLETITNALTQGYLTPLLEAEGEEDDFIVFADTSELTTRPDRSDDAMALYDRGELDGAALRRETGMMESDEPDEEELANWAFKKMLTNPQLAPTALVGLGIEVPDAPAIGVTEEVEVTSETVTGDEPNDEESIDERGIPDTQDDGPDGDRDAPPEFAVDPTVLVLESYVLRALEVARSRTRGGSKGDPFHDAWDYVEAISRDIRLDPIMLVERLDRFCRTLHERDVSYSRDSLERLVQGLRNALEVAA